MFMILGVPVAVLSGQLLLGVINGAFYALLSLGLAVIFGLLKIINFAHGAMYMLGALVAVVLFDALGINYWIALFVVPLLVGSFGMLIEYFLRAGTEDAQLMQGFGINVPLLVSLTYGFGVMLAAFAGVLSAPIYSVTPMMGSHILIVVFAVVVIGGMGSIAGAIITGILMGVIEGLTKTFYPSASSAVIFLVMVVVLLVRPSGLFGREE